LSSDDTNDPKLQQIIDTVLSQRKEVTSQLKNHWEELKTDRQRRLSDRPFVAQIHDIDRFLLRESTVEIKIERDSPYDVTMWKQFLMSAISILNL
ncbi:hypothetical protein PENTCL1PPCAC_23747, partial [Pristionchus entomophagus]